MRAPSFVHLQVLPQMMQGWKGAGSVVILGSVGLVRGDVDR
jgi:NADH:ubiquinone oxidoreductase subunit D